MLERLFQYRYYYITGVQNTLIISFFALIIGASLGVLLSSMKISKHKPLQFISKAYIEFIRGTPLMVQILLVYFGASDLFKVDINAFAAGLVAVSMNSGAYIAEIIRSGIQSIDRGQTEAGRSLGLTERQTMRVIVMPQAIKNILPALGNEFVTLIKETSMASTIGVAELMYGTRKVQAATYRGTEPLVWATLLYFLMTFTMSRLIGLIERRMAHND
ncbi:MAG: amino acid ABC transporter permease [Tissierellia bacterium]|nr:amino acid ABC transporter permease [Tissierellia bacterium]